MSTKVSRQTVDLSDYPDLIVIYLGMRVRGWRGLKTLIGFGKPIQDAAAAQPDGLLLHENCVWSLLPPHAGMRQYWRDWESLERWARSEPHRKWWAEFLRDSGATGFWHETYARRGGFEAVYDDMDGAPTGMLKFAPGEPAKGSHFSARKRLRVTGEASSPAPVSEQELYAK
jgi:hypothetical protein